MPLSMPERHSLRGVRLGDVAATSVAERTASMNPTERKPEQVTEMDSTGGRHPKADTRLRPSNSKLREVR